MNTQRVRQIPAPRRLKGQVRPRRKGLPLLAGLVVIVELLPFAASAETLFGLVDTGELFASADLGASWALRATLPVGDAKSLIATTSSSSMVLTTRSGTVYVSGDGGASWTAVGAVPVSDVVDMTARADNALLVVAAHGSVWASTDGGVTFDLIGATVAPDVVAMARDAAGTLFSLTATGEVSVSVDDGATWTSRGAITTPDAADIVSSDPDLYVLNSTGDIWKSGDDGQNWAPIGTLSQVHMAAVVSASNRLIAATRESDVAQSVDGATWEWIGVVNQMNLVGLATDAPVIGVVEDAGESAVHLTVGAPWPNPYPGSGEIVIPVRSSRGTRFELVIYDVQGRQIQRSQVNGLAGPGGQRIHWSPVSLPAGLYLARVRVEGFAVERKIVVVR